MRLNDKKAEVRAAAAVSLAAVGDARAMDPLRARLKKEKDKGARAAMTQALDDLKTAILSEIKP
jgi:HEAT repeat protein